VDIAKLSREDLMVGAGGILLAIDLLLLDWYSVPSGPNSAGYTAVSAPYAIWGVLAFILALAVVADLSLARFSPATAVPTTQLGRDMTRAAVAGVMLLVLVIKFVSLTNYFGLGFYLGMILAIVVAAGAWLNAQGRATPLGFGGAPE